MTRGNFVLITNTANWMSIQFNGDMYPSCNGKFVYHMFTDEALQSLIEHIEKSNDFSDNASKYTALKAYALQAMKHSQDIFEI